ncbi:MAG TPA: hypothetical protein VNA86_04655, partial [bacterium]|nr:hypothetical protein [bacterium]
MAAQAGNDQARAQRSKGSGPHIIGLDLVAPSPCLSPGGGEEQRREAGSEANEVEQRCRPVDQRRWPRGSAALQPRSKRG